jgi:hypothetical protein
MKKVVVERPRWGSRQRNNKFGVRLRYIPDHDYEEQPKKARGFESYGTSGSRKWFTDVLGPLAGFLRKNVGRPWDKVYSELCAGLDKRKVTGKHIFDHVDDMVERHCFIGNDGKMYTRRYGIEYAVGGMYVHPRTGLLCEVPVTARRERELERREREACILYLTDTFGYRKHHGIWYRVKLKPMFVDWEHYKRPPVVRDIFLKKDVSLSYGQHWIAVEKWQCGRSELAEIRRLLEEREKKLRKK